MSDPQPLETIDPATALGAGLEAARSSSLGLARLARLAQFGTFGVGLATSLLFLVPWFVGPPPSRLEGVRKALAATLALAVSGLVGTMLGRLLRALAGWIDLRVELAEAERQRALGLERLLASVLERLGSAPERREAAPRVVRDERAADEVRGAIRGGRWGLVDSLLGDFLRDHPDHPEGARLSGEREEALRGRIAAACEANDPDRVLELRDVLAPRLAPDSLRTLDIGLASWFMSLIQKRLRGGTIGLDVVRLADQVAGRLDDTPEGASLRAALPTLRRSVGLCARCGQPYAGIADACPACEGAVSSPVPGPAIPQFPEDEPQRPGEVAEYFESVEDLDRSG